MRKIHHDILTNVKLHEKETIRLRWSKQISYWASNVAEDPDRNHGTISLVERQADTWDTDRGIDAISSCPGDWTVNS